MIFIDQALYLYLYVFIRAIILITSSQTQFTIERKFSFLRFETSLKNLDDALVFSVQYPRG